MTGLQSNPDRPELDAYMDGLLSDPDRERIAREVSGRQELQFEVELQRRIDQSLRRRFVPGTIPEDLLAKLREDVPALPMTLPLRRRRFVLAVASSAAALIWGILGWQYLTNSSKAPRYNPNVPLHAIYASQVEAGFRPMWVCDDDHQFASTFFTRQGQGLLLTAMPEGSKMVGLTYCGGISRYTTTMLARVADTPVMVFVDRLSADTHPRLLPRETKLHLFRKELDSLVLYELTPLDRPSVMGYLYSAPVPPSK